MSDWDTCEYSVASLKEQAEVLREENNALRAEIERLHNALCEIRTLAPRQTTISDIAIEALEGAGDERLARQIAAAGYWAA